MFTRSQIEAAVKAVKAEQDGKSRPASTVPTSKRPPPPVSDPASGYARMAADADREAEAREWAEALFLDVADEPETTETSS